MTQTLDFLAPLNDLVVLRIAGDDARSFLHAQLSNDIGGLGLHEARLAAYCTPKGRMLGSFVLWPERAEAGSPLLALVKADIVEPLLKRLRMFVLRAKVSFELTDLKVYGASFHAGETAATWQVERRESHSSVRAPSANSERVRCWVISGPETDTATLAARLGLQRGTEGLWQAQDIEAGLGWVEAANLELFIPQSLNYDLNGGVSFTKGCYPGQEVVARAHFRGVVKRRGVAASCRLPADRVVKPGEDVFDARRPQSAAGRIINAACLDAEAAHTREWYVFVEINLSDLEQADFRVCSAEGPGLELLPLPYPLDAGSRQ